VKLRGGGVRVEGRLQVGRSRHVLHAVGGISATIGLRPLDFGEPIGAHLTGFDESRNVVTIDLRPGAVLAARGEGGEREVVIDSVCLAIDPAEAEGDIERLRPGHAGCIRQLLAQLESHAVVRG